MTWRRFWTALSIAILFAAAIGAQAPTYATVDKTALLSGMAADETSISGWVLKVGHQMGYLGSDARPIIRDISFADSVIAQLHRRTLLDLSPSALSADSSRFAAFHAELMALEAPKVDLAGQANAGRGDLHRLGPFVYNMELAGGKDPSSPIHSQTAAIEGAMLAAKVKLDTGIALLGQAGFSTYPASLSKLGLAGVAINDATARLAVVDQLAIEDQSLLGGAITTRVQLREGVRFDFVVLVRLRTVVFTDPNLDAGERANLLTQINDDIVALHQLDLWLTTSANISQDAVWVKLLSEPGVFLLIRPKAAIMLAAAADRSAIQKLNALVPVLQGRIAAAVAHHRNVTYVSALLADMTAQLGQAGADIAPIDGELEPMTANVATQLGPDYRILQSANAAVTDGNSRLTTAKSDAALILAGT